MHPSSIEIIGVGLFTIAVIHTFSTKLFEHLAHMRPRHAGMFHLLGEVEVVFGFWAMVLIFLMMGISGKQATLYYLDSQNFTEPLFVFAIMVVAGSKPILELSLLFVRSIARLIPLPGGCRFYFATLCFIPLLGSFITEPAAMTLGALILRDHYYTQSLSTRLKYITLGVLFVNVSIGGTLTPFAAPPVLMVAHKWGWDLGFMFTTFGWRTILAVMMNALLATWVFQREFLGPKDNGPVEHTSVPFTIMMVHLLFLIGIVIFSHHPVFFIGLLLFFLGFAQAYPHYQSRLILREGLLVAFFLAGLVVLGGQQKWWLQEVLSGMNVNTVYFGATLLTAITDNALLTYLGSLVEGLSADFKYALVSGAVTGGGLTIIANAPNPAGFSILRGRFNEGTINPIGLLLAALLPTAIAMLAFRI
ncbi:MAG: putative Na+/H+ antiporter [Gammaproteobacteria bacterium]|nr:putative Na+/H+ antiporter [Gammaproteobacteria bacterium]